MPIKNEGPSRIEALSHSTGGEEGWVEIGRSADRTVRRWEKNGWHFAVRYGKTMYVCWAKREPTVADDPIREPGEVFFEFGPTGEIATRRLEREVFEVE